MKPLERFKLDINPQLMLDVEVYPDFLYIQIETNLRQYYHYYVIFDRELVDMHIAIRDRLFRGNLKGKQFFQSTAELDDYLLEKGLDRLAKENDPQFYGTNKLRYTQSAYWLAKRCNAFSLEYTKTITRKVWESDTVCFPWYVVIELDQENFEESFYEAKGWLETQCKQYSPNEGSSFSSLLKKKRDSFKVFNRRQALHGNLPEPLFERAFNAFDQKRYLQSLQYINECLKCKIDDDDDRINALILRGNINIRLGKPEAAEMDFKSIEDMRIKLDWEESYG